jgi:DNA polymerase-3 subunit alpha
LPDSLYSRPFNELSPSEKRELIEQEEDSINSLDISDSEKVLMRLEAKRRLFHPEDKVNDFLVFDTETTGLPRSMSAPISDSESWPHIVQISWITVKKNSIRKKEDHIIKPEGFSIPYESARIHGISDVYASVHGESLRTVLLDFMEDVESSSVIIGHNLEFDKKVVQAELYRLQMEDPFKEKKLICTMKQSTDFCAFRGTNGRRYRYPKLGELYKKLFNKHLWGAHNSLKDVEATYECYKELVKRGVI